MTDPSTLIVNNPSGRGQSAQGLVVEAVPYRGRGKVQLVDDIAGPVGEPVSCYGCAGAGVVGERIPLHRHAPEGEWHLALPGDYPKGA